MQYNTLVYNMYCIVYNIHYYNKKYVCVLVWVWVWVWVWVCMYGFVYVCIYVCECVSVCACIYMQMTWVYQGLCYYQYTYIDESHLGCGSLLLIVMQYSYQASPIKSRSIFTPFITPLNLIFPLHISFFHLSYCLFLRGLYNSYFLRNYL